MVLVITNLSVNSCVHPKQWLTATTSTHLNPPTSIHSHCRTVTHTMHESQSSRKRRCPTPENAVQTGSCITASIDFTYSSIGVGKRKKSRMVQAPPYPSLLNPFPIHSPPSTPNRSRQHPQSTPTTYVHTVTWDLDEQMNELDVGAMMQPMQQLMSSLGKHEWQYTDAGLIARC
jgi:hypothetical protein